MRLNEKLQEWLDKSLAKGKKSWLALLGILGILLLSVSSLPTGNSAAKTESRAETGSDTDWASKQESRLESILSQMDGAGKARVMITLESGQEAVYALDTRTDSNGSTQKEHVMLNGSTEALVETIWMPQVQGVAVLCEGAGTPTVERKIIEMVSVLLGVSSNRISIAKLS